MLGKLSPRLSLGMSCSERFPPFPWDGTPANLTAFTHYSPLAMVEENWDLGDLGLPEISAVRLIAPDCKYDTFYEPQYEESYKIVDYTVGGGF